MWFTISCGVFDISEGAVRPQKYGMTGRGPACTNLITTLINSPRRREHLERPLLAMEVGHYQRPNNYRSAMVKAIEFSPCTGSDEIDRHRNVCIWTLLPAASTSDAAEACRNERQKVKADPKKLRRGRPN